MKHLNPLRILSIIAVILSSTMYVNAQTAAKTDEAKTTVVTKGAASYIETFFKKYKTSTDSAVDYLFSTNKKFTNTTQITLLKMKLDSLRASIGTYTGKELISQKNATPSLVLYSYMVKHEDQPIRFVFMFYKAKNDWVFYRFNFDDAMDVELLDAAKINNKR